MRVVVEASAGPRAGGRWLLRPGERLVFGRTEKSDIMISEDSLMSSRHFQVSIDQTSCTVEDLSSTNGTWIGEKQIAQASLIDGDQIIAGQSTFLFKVDARDAYERTTADAQKKLSESRRLSEEMHEIDSPDNLKTGNTKVDQARAETRDGESDFHSSPALTSDRGKTSEIDRADSSRFPMSDKPPVSDSPSKGKSEKPKPSSSPAPSRRIVPAAGKSPSAGSPKVPLDPKLPLEAKQMASGLWVVQQKDQDVAAAAIVSQLIQAMPATFMIDGNRTGLTLRAEDENSPSYLMANLPPSAAALVSPRLIQPMEAEEFETWMDEGWGQDGMIALFSLVEAGPMLEHFQSMMNSTANDSDGSRGMIGLCWPSVLESTLTNGNVAFAGKVIEPIDAILLDSAESPGGWALLGDQRLLELLAKCNLPFTIFEPNKETDALGDV